MLTTLVVEAFALAKPESDRSERGVLYSPPLAERQKGHAQIKTLLIRSSPKIK